MKNKIISVFLIAIAVLNLSGCAQAGKGEKQPVTIYLRNYADHKGAYSEEEPDADFDSMTRFMADRFIAQYDKYDVTVVTEYFQLADEKKYVSSKFGKPDATDVVLQDSFVNLGYLWEGRLLSLDDMVSDELRRDVDSHLWDKCEVNGRTYMLPFAYIPTPLIYNRQMFREAGLEALLPPEGEIADWTVEQWDEITASLRASLPETSAVLPMFGVGEAGDMINMMFLRMYGNPFYDEIGDTCVNDENGIRALQWMTDNEAKGYYPYGAVNLNAEDDYALFRNGQLAVYMGNNVIKDATDELGLDTGFAYYPSVNGGNVFYFMYTFAAFDNNDPARAEVSKDFLKFVYSDPECMDLFSSWGALPASNSIYQAHFDDIYMAQAWLDCRERVLDFTNMSPNYPGIREVFNPEIARMIAGEQTPQQTAANLEKRMNEAIARGRSGAALKD